MFSRFATIRSAFSRVPHLANTPARYTPAGRLKWSSLVVSLAMAVSLLAATGTTGTGYALPTDPLDPPLPPGIPTPPPPPPTCFGFPATIVRTAPGTIYGTAGPDVIVGSSGNDVIYGLGGDDKICGMGGNDVIHGGLGNDRLSGGTGTDSLSGGAGLDSCYGDAASECEFPVRITRAEIESLVRTDVDEFIQGTKLYWGHISGRPVEATRVDSNTLHVDLDLAYRVNNWWDPEVDVDFDLDLSCSAGRISGRPSNVKFKVDSAWYSEVLSLGIAELADSIASGILNGIAGLFADALGTSASLGLTVCPSIFVQTNGDVVFDAPFS